MTTPPEPRPRAVADLPPKSLEDANGQFVELYGSALVMNTYLKIALVLVSLVALALVGLVVHVTARAAAVDPIIIRIDDVGRAEAVRYDADAYVPQPPELRYFLTQFTVKHFSRIRATIHRDYPVSLFFLDPQLAEATLAPAEAARVVETFVTDPSADDIDIVVQNVSLSNLSDPPYHATVTFQQVVLAPGTRRERRRHTYVAQITFVIQGGVPNELIRVNPLGVQITYFRLDQAFEEAAS